MYWTRRAAMLRISAAWLRQMTARKPQLTARDKFPGFSDWSFFRRQHKALLINPVLYQRNNYFTIFIPFYLSFVNCRFAEWTSYKTCFSRIITAHNFCTPDRRTKLCRSQIANNNRNKFGLVVCNQTSVYGGTCLVTVITWAKRRQTIIACGSL